MAADTTSRQRDLIAALFAEPPAGQRILEIGVGAEGGLIGHLEGANDVQGLDASAAAVSICRSRGLAVNQFNADRDAVPFPDNSFDIVFAFEVCEHLANPQFAIEQIRRVLAPGGRFIASTPNPLTHHWPRYFYPQLIERDAFRDFLLVNKLHVAGEHGLASHWYDNIVTTPQDKAWSWIWDCTNAERDAAQLTEIAARFWSRIDAYGIRSRPMETADLARAAHEIDPGSLTARGLLAGAQVYRLVNGEAAEFQACVSALVAEAQHGTPRGIEARYWLCATEIEMAKFNRSMLAEADFQRIFGEVGRERPELAAELTGLMQDALALAKRL